MKLNYLFPELILKIALLKSNLKRVLTGFKNNLKFQLHCLSITYFFHELVKKIKTLKVGSIILNGIFPLGDFFIQLHFTRSKM